MKKNSLIQSIENKTNRNAQTANGAVSNRSSLDECVDLFARIGALRGSTVEDKQNSFARAFSVNPEYALRIALYARDIRSGQGERQTFRDILVYLANNQKDICIKLIPFVAEYGRFDDLYSLKGTECWNAAINYFATQLNNDWLNYLEKKTISLAPKWAASINTSSKETVAIGYEIAKKLAITPRMYRQRLSAMRNYLDVIERKTSANQWDKINYERVPSNASLLYRKAFSKHDGTRYCSYLESVEKGEKKINASTLYPYDIIRKVRAENDKTANVLWNALPNYFGDDNKHNGLVVCDVSGSMMSGMGGVAPIDVSVSLAIYFAERNEGDFKNYFLTFSDRPELIKIIGNNISEKFRNVVRSNWAMSTDIQAVFDLILNKAKQDKISQTEMPEAIYIISDMELNNCSSRFTNFEVIKKKYASSGYKMPKLIFWNVNAQNKQFPITVNDDGVCMVSGCSPSILKSLLSGKEMTPISIMEETILKKRYDVVKEILA